VYIRALN